MPNICNIMFAALLISLRFLKYFVFMYYSCSGLNSCMTAEKAVYELVSLYM
jgi:hypothetical protein